MLSILAAARDYQQALSRISEYIEQTIKDLDQSKLTPEQAVTRIFAHSRPGLLLLHQIKSSEVIHNETVHFTREHKRNERKAEKLREDRINAALGRPKINRGDGREFGKLGAAKSKPVLGQIEPDPGVSQPAKGYQLDFDESNLEIDEAPDSIPVPDMDATAQSNIAGFLDNLDTDGNVKKG